MILKALTLIICCLHWRRHLWGTCPLDFQQQICSAHFEAAQNLQQPTLAGSSGYSNHMPGRGNPPPRKFKSPEIWQREFSTWAGNKGIEECQMYVDCLYVIQLNAIEPSLSNTWHVTLYWIWILESLAAERGTRRGQRTPYPLLLPGKDRKRIKNAAYVQ